MQFSGSHPRGGYASSNKSVCVVSLGTVPTGAWFALLMRLGFGWVVGSSEVVMQVCGSQACLLSKAAHVPCRHTVALTSTGSLLLRRGHAAVQSSIVRLGYKRAALVYRGISSKCFHLALFWRCWLRKSQPGSNGIGRRQKYPSHLPQAATAFSARTDPGKGPPFHSPLSAWNASCPH